MLKILYSRVLFNESQKFQFLLLRKWKKELISLFKTYFLV